MNAVKKFDHVFELKRAHVSLLKHPETCLYAGIIMMGDSTVSYDDAKCPTAYTDGVNKRYGAKFMETLSRPQLAGLVLHENFHVMLKHIPRHMDLFRRNPKLANIAADYVVNDMIAQIKDKQLAQLPPGALYDPMFTGWSVRQVYEHLEKEEEERQEEQQQGDGQGKPEQGSGNGQPQPGKGQQRGKPKGIERGDPLDEHDTSNVENMTPEELKKVDEKVQDAIHQGGILAGKFGVKLPRQITDMMKPEIDWREILRDFWSSHMRGQDEYTYARLNRRRLSDNLYLPSMYSERVGRVVLAIDTSGSIGTDQLNLVAAQVAQLCEVYPPEEIVILWWDTHVRAKQEFSEGSFANITSLMKPAGGGGTRAGCVSQYMIEQNMAADCVIVLTDGHLEGGVDWRIQIPTMWIIDKRGNENFTPPPGTQKVKINK
jgi:predicted metal-dependent peptidase